MTITVTAGKRSHLALARKRKLVVGSKKLSVRAGNHAKVQIKLNAAGRKLLAERHAIRVTITIETKAGKHVSTRTVTLRAKRRTSHLLGG